MSTDQFNVTATVTPASGLVAGSGAAFTVAITGDDVQTTTTSETVNVSLNLQAADGATGELDVPIVMSKVVTTDESVTIVSATDTDGRVYTVAADGLSVSSTA